MMLECQSRQVPMKSKRTILTGMMFELCRMDGVCSHSVGLLHIAASAKDIRKLLDGNHVLD